MFLLICVLLVVFILLIIVASNGSQPTCMSCREMRNRYGTPGRGDARLPGGGYQPFPDNKTANLKPPPKKP